MVGNCISLIILKAQDLDLSVSKPEVEEETGDWVSIASEIQNCKHFLFQVVFLLGELIPQDSWRWAGGEPGESGQNTHEFWRQVDSL